MYLSDSYQQSRYEPYPHSSESTALSSPQGWRVQDSGAVGYYPPTSYDAPNDFKHSCFSEETMMTARSSGHDVQGTSNASGMVPSYSLPPPESFNEVGSHNTISIDDFTPSNSPLNATAITNATYIEGVHWIAFSTQSSALVPYNYYTNTDTVAAGANTFEHQVSHNQSRSQSVLQNKRGHSCGLGCEDLLQDSEILQHMNQRHRDKKGGKDKRSIPSSVLMCGFHTQR
ncbi:hypothetical protein EV421DRAFT_1732102 [Armillaria borealis]|uniref:Uncharacterized protein n=1 Tax=Armillaria borealis TaxID=47425 RepID=A0AA39JWF1_9AGAR|nr:hypothetical protein EV421DRAFT_1732102 [Armillaria borealis]